MKNFLIIVLIVFSFKYSQSQNCNNINFDNNLGTQGWNFYLLDSGDYSNGQYLEPATAIDAISNSNSTTIQTGGASIQNSTIPSNISEWFKTNNWSNLNGSIDKSYENITNNPDPNFRQGNADDTGSFYSTLARNEFIVDTETTFLWFTGVVIFKQLGNNPQNNISTLSNNMSFYNFRISIETNANTTTPVDLIITPDHLVGSNSIIETSELSVGDGTLFRAIRFEINLDIKGLINYCDANSKIIIESVTSEEAFNDLKLSTYLGNSFCSKYDELLVLTNPQTENQYCMNTPFLLIEPTFNNTSGSGIFNVYEENNSSAIATFTYDQAINHSYSFPYAGNFTIEYEFGENDCELLIQQTISIVACSTCNYCTSFELIEGKEYIIDGWTSLRQDDVSFEEIPNLINFNDCIIELEFLDNSNNSLSSSVFSVRGVIIDGWQKIKGNFVVPVGTADMAIRLINNSTKTALFDDIRVHPKEGTMKSFVYDTETKKLMAELDENNYATFYEYNKEGGLIRVKKETERGIHTIQETRSKTVKSND